MDLGVIPAPDSQVKCLSCGRGDSLGNWSHSGTWIRSVKRKYDQLEEKNRFVIPGLAIPHVARVEIENECVALREMVSSQQETIEDLLIELEEERDAASSAANEAMSMILRLQREKAEVEMDSRQFKRFAEEKMAHDNQELLALENLLYKRDQSIQSLTCEVQAYKHRMMSFGLTEEEAEGIRGFMSRNNSELDTSSQCAYSVYDYPPLKCNVNETNCHGVENEDADIDKYAFGETPHSLESLKDLEDRINQLERAPRRDQPDGELFGTKNILEKVIVGQSPRKLRHSRKFSNDSSSSFFATIKETAPDFSTGTPVNLGGGIRKMEYSLDDEYSNMKRMDDASDFPDDVSDRVYTIDSIHPAVPSNVMPEHKVSDGIADSYATTPRDALNYGDNANPEIQKLYMRLGALEADRESMRQTIVSMGTDKAQLVLLKEIAHHFFKEKPPSKTLDRKPSLFKNLFSLSIFKIIPSLAFWRNKAHHRKYTFGQTSNTIGLSTILDERPHVGQCRCLSSRQV